MKDKYVPINMEAKFLDRIEAYMEVHNLTNRSEAIRRLLKIGLNVMDFIDDNYMSLRDFNENFFQIT